MRGSVSQFAAEHELLLSTATQTIAELSRFEHRIQTGDVSYAQHRVYSERARGLSRALETIVALLHENKYLQAFCLLRPALEQSIFDRLLCLADRHVQTMSEVPEDTYATWRSEWKAGVPWAKNIYRMERTSKGAVRLELRGVRSQDPSDDTTISVYYFLLEQYQPLVPPAKELPLLLPTSRLSKREIAHANRQHELYHASLSWSALLKNLRLNGLANATDCLRVGVHYRFLSSFVHPLTDHSQDLYGRKHRVGGHDHYDHFSSELGLLYAIVFALYELESLLRVSSRLPAFTVDGLEELEDLMSVARAASQHLWFVRDTPHVLDRINEANRRHWEEPDPNGATAVDPRTLTDNEVRYYQDPLRRMVSLHRSVNEHMGHSYHSPWPRQDAQFR